MNHPCCQPMSAAGKAMHGLFLNSANNLLMNYTKTQSDHMQTH